MRARVKARLPVSQPSGNLVFSPNVSQLSTPVHDNLVFADITTDPPEKSYVPPASIDVVAGSLVVNAAVVAAASHGFDRRGRHGGNHHSRAEPGDEGSGGAGGGD